jgi:hypothetical protein
MTSVANETAKLPAADNPQTEIAAAAKKDDDDAPKVTPAKEALTDASPYDRLRLKLHEIRDARGNHDVWDLTDMDSFLQKADVLPEDVDVEELSDKEMKTALSKLTQTQVDDLAFAILPKSVHVLQHKMMHEIMTADPRNGMGGSDDDDDDDDCGMILCCNTASSYYMVNVVSNKLTTATKVLKQAVQTCNASDKEVPKAASKALEVVVATVLAIDGFDHWRCDTEDSDSVDQILQRIGKLAKDLFWFTNAELDIDELTRQGLLQKLDEMGREWQENAKDMGYSIKPLKYKFPKNRQGMGRSLKDANPRPAKKAKTVVAAQSAPASTGMKNLASYFSSTNDSTTLPSSTSGAPSLASGSQQSLTSYFSNIQDKLNLRVKTLVQLKIVSLADPKKCDYVVVSGSIDLKKLNHLVAYVTGCTSDYHYHSQKGTSLPDSRFELSTEGYKTCWMTGNKEIKKAPAASVDAVLDKSIKIVQVFQGLTCHADGTMEYDSDLAKSIITNDQSLVFVANNQRFAVSVMAIAPSKCHRGTEKAPLPKIVRFRDNQTKTGFGRNFKQCKWVLQGDRSDPKWMTFGFPMSKKESETRHFLHWANPICQMDGSRVYGPVYMERLGLFQDFQEEDVATAGRPNSFL